MAEELSAEPEEGQERDLSTFGGRLGHVGDNIGGFFGAAWRNTGGAAINYFQENGLSDVKEWGAGVAEATPGFFSYYGQNPDRILPMAGQGLLNAGASATSAAATVVSGAAGLVWDIPGLVKNSGSAVINGGVWLASGHENAIPDSWFGWDPRWFSGTRVAGGWGVSTFESTKNFVDMSQYQWAGGAEVWEARNGYERGLMHGTQAVGEIGTFIVAAALTGGAAGAALGAARGGAAAVRGIQGARSIGAIAQTTADGAGTGYRMAANFTGWWEFKEGAFSRRVLNPRTGMYVDQVADRSFRPVTAAIELGLITPAAFAFISLAEGAQRRAEEAENARVAQGLENGSSLTDRELARLNGFEEVYDFEGLSDEFKDDLSTMYDLHTNAEIPDEAFLQFFNSENTAVQEEFFLYLIFERNDLQSALALSENMAEHGYHLPEAFSPDNIRAFQESRQAELNSDTQGPVRTEFAAATEPEQSSGSQLTRDWTLAGRTQPDDNVPDDDAETVPAPPSLIRPV